MPIMIISFLLLFLILNSIVFFEKTFKPSVESIYATFATCFMIILLISLFIYIFVVFCRIFRSIIFDDSTRNKFVDFIFALFFFLYSIFCYFFLLFNLASAFPSKRS